MAKRTRWGLGRSSGLSLIEMAIVISISSLLLTGFLRYYSIQAEKQHFETTKTRMEDLRQALTLYSMTHERLPCPASPPGSSAPSTPAEKDADPCAPDASQPPAGIGVRNADKDQSQQVWIGLVPTRELRLNGDQGRDGWGNEFTYAVSRPLTFPFGMRGNPMPYGTIAVVDENGASVLDKAGSGRYVIVSHGPSGSGAWTAQGSRKPCEPGTLAFENCNGNAAFVAAPFSPKPGPGFFDNIVIYDNQNAGGTIVDRLVVCSAKFGFYIPASPHADQDGCVLPRGICRPYLACMSLTSVVP